MMIKMLNNKYDLPFHFIIETSVILVPFHRGNGTGGTHGTSNEPISITVIEMC